MYHQRTSMCLSVFYISASSLAIGWSWDRADVYMSQKEVLVNHTRLSEPPPSNFIPPTTRNYLFIHPSISVFPNQGTSSACLVFSYSAFACCWSSEPWKRIYYYYFFFLNMWSHGLCSKLHKGPREVRVKTAGWYVSRRQRNWRTVILLVQGACQQKSDHWSTGRLCTGRIQRRKLTILG